MERREFKRNDELRDGLLTIDDKSLRCKIQNLSEGGALVRFEEGGDSDISIADIGKEVALSITVPDEQPQRYNGRVIRILDERPAKFAAIFFLRI